MTDRFRDALRGLADEVGFGDAERLAHVRTRARRVRVRRMSTVAAVVALAVVALVLPLRGGPTGEGLTATEPPSASASETPSETPTASPTTEPPSPTGSASVVAPPPTSAAADEPQITLRVADAKPTGGETVFEVHVSDRYAVAGLAFSYGVADPAHVNKDKFRSFPGAGVDNYDGEVDAAVTRCQGNLSGRADETWRYPRRFRVPGTYTAWVRVETRACGATARVAVATLRYTVTGRLWPNGPDQPVVKLDTRHSHWEPPDTIDDGPGLQVYAKDDGVVTTIHVDWGDGQAADVAFGFDHWTEGGGYNDCAQPKEFRDQKPHVVARPDHTYAANGSYSVTVTVTTASCDGTDRQSTTQTTTMVWPPPTPEPTVI